MVKVLVTGGAGFIGSNFVRYALSAHPDWHVTTLDKLTYAGRRENLHDVMASPRHEFVHDDIANGPVSGPLVERSEIVVHFAAETHVDRSIQSAGAFIRTDVEGTFVLLEAARRAPRLRRFIQISTDEVYGSVPTGASVETDELKPRNPYAASKAGADRLAYSYWATYDVPVVITRASNNYGPYQFPEKVIPLFVTNAVDDRPVPLYGDGRNVRDWLHVDDHCRGGGPADRAGCERRGLQRRRRQRHHESGTDAPDPGRAGQAARADNAGSRSPRPRPPLLPGHRQAVQPGMGAAGAVRRGAAADDRVVPGQPLVVAADQGTGPGIQGVLRRAVRPKTTS